MKFGIASIFNLIIFYHTDSDSIAVWSGIIAGICLFGMLLERE